MYSFEYVIVKSVAIVSFYNVSSAFERYQVYFKPDKVPEQGIN